MSGVKGFLSIDRNEGIEYSWNFNSFNFNEKLFLFDFKECMSCFGFHFCLDFHGSVLHNCKGSKISPCFDFEAYSR